MPARRGVRVRRGISRGNRGRYHRKYYGEMGQVLENREMDNGIGADLGRAYFIEKHEYRCLNEPSKHQIIPTSAKE